MSLTQEQLAAASRAILDSDNSPELDELRKAAQVGLGSDIYMIALLELIKFFPESPEKVKEASIAIRDRYVKNYTGL